MNEKLKKLIICKLFKDLSQSEIIHYKDSIWLINREKKEWYFEYKKTGILWYYFHFYRNFFVLFSMGRTEFEPIIIEWVEEVLNCEVRTPYLMPWVLDKPVEEVLNCGGRCIKDYKVRTTYTHSYHEKSRVEEILNYKVKGTFADI